MNLSEYLKPSFFMDFGEPNVVDFAERHCRAINNVTGRAVALYYAVRDQIFYDPYVLNYSRADFRASAVLRKGRGYCVAKAVLLAALARQQRIPSRLGFADVTNHIASPKLLEKMGTDLFIFHGYTELYLQGHWVKATPAFNLSLCENFDVKPLEFNGIDHSIFHEFDSLGRRHLEYVKDHGFFSDLPYDLLFKAYRQTYPKFFEYFTGKDDEVFSAN